MVMLGLLAAILFETTQNGVAFRLSSETTAIDPARSLFLRVEATVPRGQSVQLPDLRDRVVGFSLAEDFAEPEKTEPNGSTIRAANWRLVPEPCAEEYRIKPFAVLVDGGRTSFVAGPVRFTLPDAREPVTGAMEVDPRKDLPPLSWKLVGQCALALVVAVLLVTGLVILIRFLLRLLREHRMSPIERAWVELERLLKKGLPGRGRYKDFYVELTMVVRRYVQRKYGVKAPNLTTEEFLRDKRIGELSRGRIEELRLFLESADMVKFAGVEATPEMADAATESARGYLKSDAADPVVRVSKGGPA